VQKKLEPVRMRPVDARQAVTDFVCFTLVEP